MSQSQQPDVFAQTSTEASDEARAKQCSNNVDAVGSVSIQTPPFIHMIRWYALLLHPGCAFSYQGETLQVNMK